MMTGMSMSPLQLPSRRFSDRVRRIGFRKWYERELLSSHVHLILAILSVVAMLASFEAFQGATVAGKLMDVAFIIITGGIALWSLRRYLFLTMRAEGAAHQASCADCGAYARFKVVGDDHNPHQTEVRCNQCAHQWVITT